MKRDVTGSALAPRAIASAMKRLPARLAVALIVVFLQVVTLAGVTPVGAQQAPTPTPVPAPSALPPLSQLDYPVPGGWFYTQESRYPQDVLPFRGFTVVDDADAAFWTEFRRYGGVQVLGYPVSRRYRYPDQSGFLQQAFQRGILQWRPELGAAVMANVFDQFTAAGLDSALEAEGIPPPTPPTQDSFQSDAERRMNFITEERFLSRFFWNPVTGLPFDNEDAAWQMLGLPQNFPQRPTYLREGTGKSGPPLYLPYVIERFQKGALQLFLENQPDDPTIVPGDGKQDCVSLTAVGRLARRLGSGTMIPSSATKPEPLEIPERAYVTWFVPALASPTQQVVRFEMVGIGFDPGEPVDINLVPPPSNSSVQQANPISLTVTTDADGSFDQLINARPTAYQLSVMSERSHKTLAPDANRTLDTRIPTDNTSASSQSLYC